MRLLRRDGIRRVPGRDVPAAIVLESDGAQNRGPITPLAAARRAKAGGIRVDGIALGTARGVVRFGYGRTLNSIPVPPDPETVEQIAAVTGGNAFTARDASTLATVYRRLGQQLGR
jgi:Ca-activated chloride channel family protein